MSIAVILFIVLAAVVVVLALIGGGVFLGTRPHHSHFFPQPGPGAYQGLGTWVDIFETAAWGDPQAAVQAMQEHGVKTLYLQTSNYTRPQDIVFPGQTKVFLDAAHDTGIRVVAWYLPGLSDPKRDLQSATKVREVTHGERRISKLFSKEQRAYFATHAPEGIELDQLQIFGPIFVLKAKSIPAGAKRKLVAEVWFYPNNTRILELSTKCAPDEAFDVAARARAFLSERGIDITGEQQTKTRTALEYFSQVAQSSP
jgi:hypothetical protein